MVFAAIAWSLPSVQSLRIGAETPGRWVLYAGAHCAQPRLSDRPTRFPFSLCWGFLAQSEEVNGDSLTLSLTLGGAVPLPTPSLCLEGRRLSCAWLSVLVYGTMYKSMFWK